MPLNLSEKAATRIRLTGAVLLVAGGALAYWALQRFDSLPNYQRLAFLVPLLAAVPMVLVDQYRAPLVGASAGRAIGYLIAPLLVAVGALVWYLTDASAKV